MRATRVLVGNEPRSYREALAGALVVLRPEVETFLADPDALDAQLARVRPDVVICSSLTAAVRERATAWVELYPDGEPVANVCVRGRRRSLAYVELDDLLAVLDQVGASLTAR